MKSYYWFILVLIPFFILVAFQSGDIEKPVISSETDDCKTCHTELHPGIVKHWYNSRHSKITVAEAFKKPEIERRISTSEIEPKLQNVVVGCYECHSLNTDKHQDAFEHNGYIINVVVSPDDCATYHEVEADQYSRNMMAHAYSNLMDNPFYQDLKKSINGKIKYEHHNLSIENSNDQTESESCLYCHDTKLIVTGKEIRETEIGEMEFPVISGWPNHMQKAFLKMKIYLTKK